MTSFGHFSVAEGVPSWSFKHHKRGWVSASWEFSAKPSGPWLSPRDFNDDVEFVFDTGASRLLMSTGLVEFLGVSNMGAFRPVSMANGSKWNFRFAMMCVRLLGTDVVVPLEVAHGDVRPNRILLPRTLLQYYHVALTHSDSLWVLR
jgi:hypothetical protein